MTDFRDRFVKARALERIGKDDLVIVDINEATVKRLDVTYKSIADMALQEKVREVVTEEATRIAPIKEPNSSNGSGGYAEAFKPDPYMDSGVDCIHMTERMGFCLGNALNYLWRAEREGASLAHLKKAQWYLNREISRQESIHAAPALNR